MFAPNVAQGSAAIAFADLNQGAECVEGRDNIAGLFRYDHQLIVLLAVGKYDTKTIEDPAADRREKPQVDAVFLREDHITIRFHDLQLIHARSEGGEHACLSPSEDRRASGKEPLLPCFPPHFRLFNPRVQAALISPRPLGRVGFGPTESLPPGRPLRLALHERPHRGNRGLLQRAANAKPTKKASRRSSAA